jgi:phospholipase/carboxylesterase
MVLLHGYGADGSDLIALGTQWRTLFPDMLFVAPNAPWVCGQNPGGHEWFSLSGERSVARLEGAAQARPVIVNFLIDLWAQTGLSPRETVLCGFSQGAMMALNVGLSLDQKVAAIVGFSGLLIPPPEPWVTPPVALIHGELDGVVPFAAGEAAVTALRNKGVEVVFHASAGLGHGIGADGLDFATGFLTGKLGVKA